MMTPRVTCVYASSCHPGTPPAEAPQAEDRSPVAAEAARDEQAVRRQRELVARSLLRV